MTGALLLGAIDLAILNLYFAPSVFTIEDKDTDGIVAVIGPDTTSPATLVVPTTKTPPTRPSAVPDAATPDAAVPDIATPDAAVAADKEVPSVATDARVAVPPIAPAGDFKPESFDFHFQQDRATMKSYHQAALDGAVELLTQYPDAIAVVEGYADESETKYGINALIKRRLGKITKHLEAHGVAAERIRALNRGASASGDDSELHKNRRVHLRVEMP